MYNLLFFYYDIKMHIEDLYLSSGYSQSANPTKLDSCYIAPNRIATIVNRFYRSLSVGAPKLQLTQISPLPPLSAFRTPQGGLI